MPALIPYKGSGITMKGDAKVIEHLNIILGNELVAINQYFLHAKMYKDWGLQELGDHEYHESIDEMKHAETIIHRILFLDGVPNMQRLFPVEVGETVIEQFQLNYEMEKRAVLRYRAGSALCNEVGDPGTRNLLEELLKSEEHHVDEAEAELANLEQIGEQLWLTKWV